MAATTFNATIYMNRAFEKAAQASATDFSIACIHALADHFKFDAADAIAHLGIAEEVNVKKSAGRKKGEGKVKAIKANTEPKSKRETPAFPLPWTGSPVEGWCNGLRLNHGLHSQCCMVPLDGGDYCKTCQGQADKNASGKPTYGCVADRMSCALLEYRDPKGGKATVPFANVMSKLSITREAAEAEAEKFGLSIPEEHFVEKEAKRGRPKKSSSADTSDTDSSSGDEVEKKKRGRPKKEKKVVAASVGDDLIATLVKQATAPSKPTKKSKLAVAKVDSSDSDSGDSDASDNSQRKAEKIEALTAEFKELAAKIGVADADVPTKIGDLTKGIADFKREIKAMSKNAEKLAKEAEVEAKAEAKAKAKAEKEAEAEAKAIAKAKAKAEKEAEAEAKAEAKAKAKAEKDAEKEAKAKAKAEKEAKANAEKEAELDGYTELAAEEEEEEEAIEVKAFEHKGKKYLKSADNVVYDAETQDTVGMWNPVTECIDEIEEFEEDADSEDDE